MNRKDSSAGALVRQSNQPITRWDPWNELDQMRRQMDDVFGRVFGYTPLSTIIPSGTAATFSGEFGLSADIYETNEEIVIHQPVPGLGAEDLNIEATAGSLTIAGQRKTPEVAEKAKRHRQGYLTAGEGAFRAEYQLPVEVDPGKVRASFKNGVLEIHLPKTETAKPVSVKVNVESGGK